MAPNFNGYSMLTNARTKTATTWRKSQQIHADNSDKDKKQPNWQRNTRLKLTKLKPMENNYWQKQQDNIRHYQNLQVASNKI
jgi:hypothetical protein